MYSKGKNINIGVYGNTLSSEMISKSTSYNYPELCPKKHTLNVDAPVFTSVYDLITNKCTVNDAMDEFRRNGIDYPYDPDDNIWKETPTETKASPIDSKLTAEQMRVLRSLPESFIFELLKCFSLDGVNVHRRASPPVECRFCKNNGERELYYRSHSLKDAGGRVLCPVLRAFVCRRCGASGDNAHTIKYCPRSTDEERIKSTAILRTVRMASGRYRAGACSGSGSGSGAREARAALGAGGHAPVGAAQAAELAQAYAAPLDPLWAALEQKLSLY